MSSSSTRRWFLWAAAVLAAVALASLVYTRNAQVTPEQSSSQGLQLAEALGGDTTGYTKALAPRAFDFPRDHAAHNDYKIEWWYFTGNLTGEGGRAYGYQFTIFRSALRPPGGTAADSDNSAGWAADQLYFAHLAVADIESRTFRSFEKFSRGAAGLAGSRIEGFKVWVEDWSAESVNRQPGEFFPLRVQASDEDLSLDLLLEEGKPIVLQGDRGFSRKGGGVGQASYYYSFTSIPTSGVIETDGAKHDVVGKSWMDREWSTSLLDDGQVGWDWFSLQLDSEQELMYFRLRDGDGNASWSDGTLVGPDGSSRHFETSDIVVSPTETWTSPRSGATYPIAWQLEIPDLDANLEITAAMPNQELDVSVTYWEGSVRVVGSLRGRQVGGRGYVELTGYGEGGAIR